MSHVTHLNTSDQSRPGESLNDELAREHRTAFSRHVDEVVFSAIEAAEAKHDRDELAREHQEAIRHDLQPDENGNVEFIALEWIRRDRQREAADGYRSTAYEDGDPYAVLETGPTPTAKVPHNPHTAEEEAREDRHEKRRAGDRKEPTLPTDGPATR